MDQYVKDNGVEPDAIRPITLTNLSHGSSHNPLVIKSPKQNVPIDISRSFHPPLHPCQDPFFNSFRSTFETNGWLVFNGVIPNSSLDRLYVRDSYKTIASQIHQKNQILITGTPGIGKSLFLIYLAWRMVQAKQRVLLIYHPHMIYFDDQGGVFEVTELNFPIGRRADCWKDVAILLNGNFRTKADLARYQNYNSTFVFSTLPKLDLTYTLMKIVLFKTVYVPVWSKTEMETIAPEFNVDNWPERFEILGGMPRYVFEITDEDPKDIVKSACAYCDANLFSHPSSFIVGMSDRPEGWHSLIHMTSIAPFNKFSVCYASQTALDIIVSDKFKNGNCQMEKLLYACQRDPLVANLCECILKAYAIENLEKGVAFVCRELIDENETAPEFPMIFPASQREMFEVDGLTSQVRGRLYVPLIKTRGIDAWIPGFGGFQTTVGQTLETVSKDDLKMVENTVYFMVPALNYPSFTKKVASQDVKQYVLKVEFPKDSRIVL